MWARWVRALIEENQNTILDCDLQNAREAGLLAQAIGLPCPGPEALMLRLSVSPAVALKRLPNKQSSEVLAFHARWGTSPIPGEAVLDTDTLSEEAVKQRVLMELHAKWPA
jgi:hypothetical protein